MKRVLFLSVFAFIFIISTANAQGKFESAMKTNIDLMDSAATQMQWQSIAAKFERIADAEKDKWLAYYYAAYSNIILCYYEKTNENKDLLLDKADMYIAKADSLEPKNSEVFTLKAFSAEMRIAADPMGRYMKYGAIFENNITLAKEYDVTNPRPELLKGQMVLYTPEQFGGGFANAKPILDSSAQKFSTFVPKSEIHPNWGKAILDETMKEPVK